jgi:hypothetical protein
VTANDELNRIAATLGFTLEDLALNRAGQLSPHQSWDASKQALIASAIGLLFLAGIAAVIAVGAKSGGRVRFLYYVVCPLVVVIVAYVCSTSIGAAIKRTVLHSEGTLKMNGTGKGMVAKVGHARVLIPTDALNVLKNGDRYRIFYLGVSESFLSIEPLPAEGEPAKPQ